jgi:5-methylcytosine-specific restriction endonuclease McrA
VLLEKVRDSDDNLSEHNEHDTIGHKEKSLVSERKYKKKVDYKKAYKKYHSSKKAKLERAQRNKIGRQLKKKGIKIPKNYEIDHIKPISSGGGNDIDNIRIIPRSENRKLGQKITTRKRNAKKKKKSGKY